VYLAEVQGRSTPTSKLEYVPAAMWRMSASCKPCTQFGAQLPLCLTLLLLLLVLLVLLALLAATACAIASATCTSVSPLVLLLQCAQNACLHGRCAVSWSKQPPQLMQPLPCTAATTNLVPQTNSRILTDPVTAGATNASTAAAVPDRPL
jgi:uncharacterized membrane protein YwaF